MGHRPQKRPLGGRLVQERDNKGFTEAVHQAYTVECALFPLYRLLPGIIANPMT